MGTTTNFWRLTKRIVIRVLFYPVILLIVSALYLSTFGFPSWLLRELQGRVPMRHFAIEAEAAKIDIIRGLVLEDVKLYRKRVAGPAAVQADRVVLGIDPLAFLRQGNWVRKVSISRGTFLPAMIFVSDKTQEASSGESVSVMVELDHCVLYGVEIKSLSLMVQSDMTGVKCEDMTGVLRVENLEGPFSGTIKYDARTHACEGHVETRFDLHILNPVFEAWDMPFAIEMVNRFNFGDPLPRCEADFRRSFAQDDSFYMNGKFGFENGKYRGVDVLEADGRVQMHFSPSNSVVTVKPLTVVRADGTARGWLTVDTIKREVEFDGESTFSPKTLTTMIGIFTNGIMDPWRFEGPLRVAAKGYCSYTSYSHVDFNASFAGHNVGWGPFLAQDCTFEMRMGGPTNEVSDIRGTIYGGKFLAGAVFVAPPWDSTNPVTCSVEAKIKDVDFEKVVSAMTKEKKEYSGQLSGHVTITGSVGKTDLRTLKGEGALKIREGRVFMMPVFGGLSTTMTKIVPGLDFVLRQSDATTEFVIGDGKIHTDKILIEGDVLSFNGHGDYHLNGKLDFNAQIKLMKEHTLVAKLIAILTYPISKLFEFRLHGTVAEPQWYPVNFSRDLLEKLGLEKEKEEP